MAIASDIARKTSGTVKYKFHVIKDRSSPSSSGLAKDIMSSGKISGTPPTRVETTYKPAHAASRIAMPNDSVREVFKNIEPRTSIYKFEQI